MIKLTVITILTLTSAFSVFAQFAPASDFVTNTALSRFIDKQDFPKNITSRDELISAAAWSNKEKDTNSYDLNEQSLADPCSANLTNAFVKGIVRSDRIRKDRRYFSLTKQLIPTQNISSLNLELEYGKIFKNFGKPTRIERNQEMRVGMTQPTNEIKRVWYSLKHYGKEADVDFYISSQGCMLMAVLYMSTMYDAQRNQDEKINRNGDAISNVLK
jgi:hypothetical protein